MSQYDIHAANHVFLELFEGNAHPMWVFDLKTLRFLAVNTTAEKTYGYTRAEFLAMSTIDIRPAEEVARYKTYVRQMTDGVAQAGQWRHRRKDGAIIHMDITARKITFEGRHAELVLAINVTHHVKALESLRAAENMYRGLVEHSMVGIYIVKNMRLAYANPRLAAMFGYTPDEFVDIDILDLAAPGQRDEIVTAIRERMTSNEATGRKVVSGLRKDGSGIIVDIHNARIGTGDTAILMGVVLDITDTRRAESLALENIAQLERMLQDTLRAVSAIGEIHDAYTAGHESRVGNLAAAIGAVLGLESQLQDALRTVGLVHDAGKIGIPVEILVKPTHLSAPEFDLVKTHVQLGFDILKLIEFRHPVAEAVLQHHERIDGSGYPRGLDGSRILPLAKILAVADVVEAMSSHRPYRAALGIEVALDEISKNAGVLYDTDVSAACLRLFHEQKYEIH